MFYVTFTTMKKHVRKQKTEGFSRQHLVDSDPLIPQQTTQIQNVILLQQRILFPASIVSASL